MAEERKPKRRRTEKGKDQNGQVMSPEESLQECMAEVIRFMVLATGIQEVSIIKEDRILEELLSNRYKVGKRNLRTIIQSMLLDGEGFADILQIESLKHQRLYVTARDHGLDNEILVERIRTAVDCRHILNDYIVRNVLPRVNNSLPTFSIFYSQDRRELPFYIRNIPSANVCKHHTFWKPNAMVVFNM